MDKRTNLQKALDAYEAFNNVKKQEKKNKIDLKLIQLLDPKILEYFTDTNINCETIYASPFLKKKNTETKLSTQNKGLNKSIFLPTDNMKEQQRFSEKENDQKLIEYYFYAHD